LSIAVVQMAPAISNLSPASGPSTGGTKVIITGDSFGGASSVRFGTQPARYFKVNKAGTKIRAYAPAGKVGPPVNVTVRTAQGLSASSSADQFTYLGANSTW
jgi:hypothetical protein